MQFRSVAAELPSIPDDLSIPQFILDSQHEMRPDRPQGLPWLVADKSGKALGLNEVCTFQKVLLQPRRLEAHAIWIYCL